MTTCGTFDGCLAGLCPWHRAATATALQPGSSWLCAGPVLCSLAWAASSWSPLFLHKQKDEKLLKDTKVARGQEIEVFPLFQELRL